MHNFEGKGAHTLQMYSLAAQFLGREGGGCLLSHSQRMYTKPVSVLAGPLMPANFPRQPARAVTHTHTAHSAPATAPAHSAPHSARAGSSCTAVPLAAVPTDRPLDRQGPRQHPGERTGSWEAKGSTCAHTHQQVQQVCPRVPQVCPRVPRAP